MLFVFFVVFFDPQSAYNTRMNTPRKYKPLPIGESDFPTLISQGYYWVDKSRMIANIIDAPKVVLLPRPRRFG